MAQFDSLINAAYKAIKSADALLDTPDVPFNVVYKQYKTLQSFWFRVMDDASETGNKRLEELCVDLEEMVQLYEKKIKEISPTRNQSHPTDKQAENTAE